MSPEFGFGGRSHSIGETVRLGCGQRVIDIWARRCLRHRPAPSVRLIPPSKQTSHLLLIQRFLGFDSLWPKRSGALPSIFGPCIHAQPPPEKHFGNAVAPMPWTICLSLPEL